MDRIYLNAVGVLCSLGNEAAQVRAALLAPLPSGLRPVDGLVPGQSLMVGVVAGPLAGVDHMPMRFRSRNNALLLSALARIRTPVEAALARYGTGRVAVILGTSTSGIAEAESAFIHEQAHGGLPETFDVAQQEMGNPAQALAAQIGAAGPAYVISTACSSSAKSLASAARLLRAGLCDAVVAGGMDSLCRFTAGGFWALESVSTARCNPLSANRRGINIGEGGALFLVTREPGPVCLSGHGEASDAHHISAPAPDGRGILAAMSGALRRAGLSPTDIDYVNLHGTATPQNDSAESLAAHALFGAHTPMSSTKSLTGHVLGGAGALEAALCWLTLTGNEGGVLPPNHWDGVADPALPPLNIVAPGTALGRPLRHVLSNSCAFGGNNAALLLSRVEGGP